MITASSASERPANEPWAGKEVAKEAKATITIKTRIIFLTSVEFEQRAFVQDLALYIPIKTLKLYILRCASVKENTAEVFKCHSYFTQFIW